ncbi:MAG: alkaline phosphatase family protein, partial [Phycisphaerales bacterium]
HLPHTLRLFAAAGLATSLFTAAAFAQASNPSISTPDTTPVGHSPDGSTVTPVNQLITPYGRQLDLPGMRPQALALSPNGKLLAAAGKTNELIIIDPDSGTIRQHVPLPPEAKTDNAPVSNQVLKPDKDGQLSYTGLLFSPDGAHIYLSNVDGSVKVFSVAADGAVSPDRTLPLPEALAPRRKPEIPTGLALSPDGTKLYVCGNLSNRLHEIDIASGKTLRSIDVGVAPYDVSLVGTKAYVSNWGGRRPASGDLTGPAGRGTLVRVDPVTNIANEGSVSIIDLPTGDTKAELITGMHASGLALCPTAPLLVVCNATSDSLTIINTSSDTIVAKVSAKAKPSDLLGAAPNAATFDPSGKTLYVANGSQNAIAVFNFDTKDADDTHLAGLIPVGWYPGAVAFDAARNSLIVANIKGVAKDAKPFGESNRPGAKGFNSHHYFGSISFAPIPTPADLPALSERVARNLRAPRIAAALLPARPDQPARAIPERIGEPSLIKHVVYLIKENRTYDQVLGDMGKGNSDPDLCIFGKSITPNHHAIAEQFVLLDNTYCCGILSADGHQWSATAFSTDYMEKSFAGFPRSYPDGMGTDEDDALAYAPSGFIWDNALKHHKTIRNYGEFMAPSVHWRDKSKKGEPGFMDCYNAWKNPPGDVVFESWPSVESMRPFSPTDYVGWAMEVPDQFRADYILKDLKAFEEKGEFPQITLICLPNDHTSGGSANMPTPAAHIADNDLAFGRILEGLSHSKFWPQMAVFSIEDDPQAGWDHVSGYRTIAFCASPYAKRGAVVSTQYNTTSILRTMEQIVGLPPMNAFDASAEPMFDCFTDTPDLTPYEAKPTQVALDTL